MSLAVWLAFCLMDTVLCLTPGPAVLFVVSVALARGLRPGMAAAFGILATNALYFALSATGIAAVIVASATLFGVLKAVGAAYLVWIGLRMLLARGNGHEASDPRADHRAFLRGIIVQGSNPKALIFFVALVPQFIDPAGRHPRRERRRDRARRALALRRARRSRAPPRRCSLRPAARTRRRGVPAGGRSAARTRAPVGAQPRISDDRRTMRRAAAPSPR